MVQKGEGGQGRKKKGDSCPAATSFVSRSVVPSSPPKLCVCVCVCVDGWMRGLDSSRNSFIIFFFCSSFFLFFGVWGHGGVIFFFCTRSARHPGGIFLLFLAPLFSFPHPPSISVSAVTLPRGKCREKDFLLPFRLHPAFGCVCVCACEPVTTDRHLQRRSLFVCSFCHRSFWTCSISFRSSRVRED